LPPDDRATPSSPVIRMPVPRPPLLLPPPPFLTFPTCPCRHFIDLDAVTPSPRLAHDRGVWNDWPTFPSPPISRIVNWLIFRPNLPSDLIYLIICHRRRITSVRGGQPSSTYSAFSL